MLNSVDQALNLAKVFSVPAASNLSFSLASKMVIYTVLVNVRFPRKPRARNYATTDKSVPETLQSLPEAFPSSPSKKAKESPTFHFFEKFPIFRPNAFSGEMKHLDDF